MVQSGLIVLILANNSLFSTMWKLDRLGTDVYSLSGQVSGRVWLWPTKGTYWPALVGLEGPRGGLFTALNMKHTSLTARPGMTVIFFPEPTFSPPETLSSPDVRGAMLGAAGTYMVGI